jgi:alginate O-acetyltransferase complex protein AlgJ
MLVAQAWLRPAQAATAGLTVIGKDGWLFPLWDAMSRFDQQQLRSTIEVVNEAVGAIRAAGINVAVALFPSKARIYRQYLPDEVRLPADIDRRYQAALAGLRRPGVLVPDLDTPFRAARSAQPARQLYFKADTHWMPAGAEIAAVELARQMRDTFRLPPSERPGTRFDGVATLTNTTGDLLQWVPAADRGNYPAERYYARRIAASGSAALLEEDAADVVVVGNSFVQPKFGFSAVLSNQIERPVALAWKSNNYGGYYTLLEYVKSEGFRQQRPKVLVWAHLEFDMQNPPNSSSWGPNAMSSQTFLAELKRALGA